MEKLVDEYQKATNDRAALLADTKQDLHNTKKEWRRTNEELIYLKRLHNYDEEEPAAGFEPTKLIDCGTSSSDLSLPDLFEHPQYLALKEA